MRRNITVVKDADDRDIVLINDILFKGKRRIDWDDVRDYLKSYVGDVYQMSDSKESVYIGADLPNEYTGSEYTYSLKGMHAKAKANAAQGLPEIIETATGGNYRKNNEEKHARNAKYGWYRFDSRFALPVYGNDGEIERHNVFHTSLLVRHDEGGKKYLYDIIDIKKKRATRLDHRDRTRQRTRFCESFYDKQKRLSILIYARTRSL